MQPPQPQAESSTARTFPCSHGLLTHVLSYTIGPESLTGGENTGHLGRCHQNLGKSHRHMKAPVASFLSPCLAPSASSLYNFLLAASEFSSYRALVPPTSPLQAQPNAHLHDQGKFDPGRRSAAKSETPGHLGNCLSPAIRAAQGSGRDSTASSSERAHSTL